MTGGKLKNDLVTLAACGLIGLAFLGSPQVCRAQTNVPADLSPDVQEVLTLSRQHMDDSVITNYILSTGKSYKLSAQDIIYLNSQGVSQPVISTLLQTASAANAQNPSPAVAPAAPSAPPAAGAPTNVVSLAAPPPVDSGSNAPAPVASAPSAPPIAAPSPTPAPQATPPVSMPMIQAPLQDNFTSDGGLNSDWWLMQSPLLASLAAANGEQVSPLLTFSPAGMQMSGTSGRHQFMGVQSKYAFTPPFTFSATVSGMSQDAVPFEIYLVSQDMQQWLSVAGHLGGRGRPRGEVHVGLFGPFGRAGFGIPTGGPSPDYGIWVNHTGNGQPISALGNMLYNFPLAGVPYTIQVSAGSDGMMTVTLLDASQMALAAQSVPVGTGPFYVVLAGRDGPTYAEWQSAELIPSTPPAPVSQAPAAPDTTPTFADFQSELAPYGAWVNLPGYGACWQPSVSPGWRPYLDGGHWEYTDAGWYWDSDYPWGDIVFHYGRWAYTDVGWVWVPGYQYAPAWVVWRHDDADGYLGWAPLPPGAVFANGGWLYNGRPVGADFDFGLGMNFFTFVGYDHFWAHDYRHWVVPHDRVMVAWGHSAVAFHYNYDHGVFVNVGMPHDRMVVLTHHDFHPVPMATFHHDNVYHGGWQDDHHDNQNWRQGNGNQGWNHGDDHDQGGGGWHH